MMNISQAIEIVRQTNPGMVRTHNEDSITHDADIGLVVLADGMGGYNAGEVASGMAVAMVAAEMKQALSSVQPYDLDASSEPIAASLLLDNARKANAAIFQASQSQPQCAGMGTTLVAALFYDNRISVVHVGDSRMYRLRGGKYEQVTKDHSLLQEQIDSGLISKEDAKLSRNKNLVTRAVGIDPDVEPEVHTYEALTGDIYLLCSDGLSDMVGDESVGQTLIMLEANLQLAADQLVQMANDNGGRDNISVILVKIKHEFPAQRSWLSRFMEWFNK